MNTVRALHADNGAQERPESLGNSGGRYSAEAALRDPVNLSCSRELNCWLNEGGPGGKAMLAARLGLKERTLESYLYLQVPWPAPVMIQALAACPDDDGNLTALNNVLAVVGATGARKVDHVGALGPVKRKLASSMLTIAKAEEDGRITPQEDRAIKADLRDVVAEASAYLGERGQ